MQTKKEFEGKNEVKAKDVGIKRGKRAYKVVSTPKNNQTFKKILTLQKRSM